MASLDPEEVDLELLRIEQAENQRRIWALAENGPQIRAAIEALMNELGDGQ